MFLDTLNQLFLREVLLFNFLKHPNLLIYYFTFCFTDQCSLACLIGGELFSYW